MWVAGTTGKVWGRIYNPDNTQVNLPPNAVLPAGQWSHVVMVANASSSPASVSQYVNGERVGGPLTYSGTLRSGSVLLYLGKQLTAYFKGSIDEVRIYNRALSDTEIRGNYNATK